MALSSSLLSRVNTACSLGSALPAKALISCFSVNASDKLTTGSLAKRSLKFINLLVIGLFFHPSIFSKCISLNNPCKLIPISACLTASIILA